ncbi:MAG: TonB-dependent receptor [Bacteroidales bacterium]|nr:TonB-dependent receptor [Bacteroidales bacterium]MBQ2149866.1 TonB-dependent receptor [Bacteroidales bacterium]
MKKISLVLTTLLMAFTLFAQNVAVRGTVTDATTGEPVAFASIQVKGTMTGASTGLDGTYSLNAPANAVLVVSFIGYKTQEIAVNGRTVVDCVLAPDAEFLDDVIVVGYGTTRREAKTGAVSTVKADEIAVVPASSVDKMLAGKMAGVTISSETGQPGSNSQIRIRGTSSINAGNEPLWVVDGIPVMSGDQSYFTNTNNAIAAINPNDIESLTVLKDAAAASIYGSRAANGVILVTTKSGKAGKASFSARAKYGISKLSNDNHFRMMTGPELYDFYKVAYANAGRNIDDYYDPSTPNKPMTNWIEEVTRLGKLQEYEVNAQAGTDRGRFYSSLSYQDNQGVSYATSYKRLTGRVNSDYKLTRTLDIGTRVNIAYTENHDTEMQSLYYSNPFFGGLIIRPWTPLFDPETGEYNQKIPENSNTNPLWNALCHGEDQWEKQFRTQASMYLQWEPIQGLVFKTNNMFEGTFGKGIRYWGPDPGDTTGVLQGSRSEYIQLTTSNTATYSRMFGDHSLRVMLGQEAMRRTYESLYGYAPTVDANIPYFSTSIDNESSVSDSFNARTLLSFFGNVDYNYANKYFLAASIREDGSSLFGSQNKWGTFWSVSGSWNITNEEFMKSTSDWLSLLKIRASYGVNGNNNIAPYRAYGVYASSSYNGGNGMLPSSPANDLLSWELNKTWNVGIDFAFFNNRLSGQIDAYTRNTSDMLLNKQVPQTSGFGSNFMNIGSMNNKGIEFQLEGDIIRTNDFVWTAGFNVAYNKSTVTDLGDDEWMASSYDSRLRHVVGRTFYSFYLKDYYGVDPTNGDALFRATDPEHPDDESYYLLTNDYNKARYVYPGSPEPKFTGGFNTSLNWKGLELSIFTEFKTGNYVYIYEWRYLNADGNQMTMNQMARAMNYWKQPGDTGCNPKPVAGNASNSYANSTRWLQRGDYLRIKDVTLAYNLPQNWLKKINMKGAKIYFSALNPYTFHDVYWWDPERGMEGMGWGIYPHTKTFAGGIELTF